MALRVFKHVKTGELKKSLKVLDPSEWNEVLTAPNSKMMVSANKSTGKSKIKGLQETLLERARNHSRDVDASDQMRISIENGMGPEGGKNLLNSKGEKRLKIHDL